MDRAKVNRALAEAFEPGIKLRRKKRHASVTVLTKSPGGCWHLTRYEQLSGATEAPFAKEPRNFFTSPDLVLMCLEWLLSNGHALDLMKLRDGRYASALHFDEEKPSVFGESIDLPEAIVLATAKAKGIER